MLTCVSHWSAVHRLGKWLAVEFFVLFFLENYLLPLRVVRACGSICCIRRLIKFHPMFVTIARSIGLEVNSFNGNSIPVKIPKVFSWIERRQLMRWRYVRAPVSSARWDNDVRINSCTSRNLVSQKFTHRGLWICKKKKMKLAVRGCENYCLGRRIKISTISSSPLSRQSADDEDNSLLSWGLPAAIFWLAAFILCCDGHKKPPLSVGGAHKKKKKKPARQ